MIFFSSVKNVLKDFTFTYLVIMNRVHLVIMHNCITVNSLLIVLL